MPQHGLPVSIKLDQRFCDLVDRVLLITTTCFTAWKRCEFQVYQLMHDGELHVVQHRVKWEAIFGRIQHRNQRAFSAFVPADSAQRLGLKITPADHDHRDFPILKFETLPPECQPFLDKLPREVPLFAFGEAKGRRLRRRGYLAGPNMGLRCAAFAQPGRTPVGQRAIGARRTCQGLSNGSLGE